MNENPQAYPKHDQISELKVMKSAAGYYVGREQYDKDCDAWLPYNRLSNYHRNEQQAEKTLEKVNEIRKELEPISRGNLRIIRNDLSSRLNEDKDHELKRNVISDKLDNEKPERKLEKQLNQELSR